MPPVNLVYGFGLFFRIDESCIGRHFYERRPWARNEDSDQQISDSMRPRESKSEDVDDIYKEREDSIDHAEDVDSNCQSLLQLKLNIYQGIQILKVIKNFLIQ